MPPSQALDAPHWPGSLQTSPPRQLSTGGLLHERSTGAQTLLLSSLHSPTLPVPVPSSSAAAQIVCGPSSGGERPSVTSWNSPGCRSTVEVATPSSTPPEAGSPS